jgi:amino acid adenylation domain-containing protein
MMAFSSIQSRFADQVVRAPDAVAVSSAGVRLTYRELDERANRLAHRLRELGVGPEVPVAVLVERSAAVITAFLAIVKAGGYYLPLHSAYPPERQQWIMNQSGGPVLLTDTAMLARGVPAARATIVLDTADQELSTRPASDPGPAAHPDQLAYVMYTSGSTGQPKGVAVTQRDVVTLATDRIWDSGRHQRVLMVAEYAFDVSTYEVWVPLLHGGTVVVAPHGDLDVGTLRRLLVDNEISCVHLTAGLFRVVAEEAPESLAIVREVMTGGDVVAPGAVQRVLDACPGITVRALYGPTETTLFATNSPITAPYRPGSTVPIGRPMDGMRVYVLDDRLRRVEAGVVGELYVTGAGVARGYAGRPDLTAERFVADPFAADATGERMYRTGDLARWTADGLVDFVGRADDQVKIRGFRVELAEVESVLARYAGVAHAVVVARDNEQGDKRLAAYVVPDGPAGEVDVPGLRAHVADALPEYMVPAAFTVLETLPLTPNGKVDRDALPAPDFENVSTYRAPRDATEETLCRIFADVLGVPQVGIDDSFFDLGGQSLLAMRLTLRVEAELGVRVPIAELFDAPTPIQLADLVKQAGGGSRLSA